MLPNGYHHICLSYAQMASYNYNIHGMSPDLSGRIKLVVKDLHNNKSSVDIKQFRNILRYKEVVPHLARLLNAGGIWTLDCEKAFERLVQSRIQQVCHFLNFFFDMSVLTISWVG